MEPTFGLVCSAVILFLAIVHLLMQSTRTAKLINQIPGPRLLPIIGNSLDLVVSQETLWKNLRKWAIEHYGIYRFWVGTKPVVNLCHPDDVEVLLGSQTHIDKSMFYEFLQPWLKTGLLTSTGTKWRSRRKILTPAFHFNLLQEFHDVFNEASVQLVKSIKDEGSEVVKDLVPLFAKHTLNIICETAMGTALQENDPLQAKYRNGVRHMGDVLYRRAARPWLHADWIFSLTKHGRRQKESLEALHYFTTKIINERKEYHEATGGSHLKMFLSEDEKLLDKSIPAYDIPLKKKRLAMLDLLIAVQKQHRGIDDLGIREEVDTFIFEGHDTTTMGFCFAILLLAEHKEIQARARAEVEAVFAKSNGKLEMNDLQNMTYLDRCIKESLRLFPPVPTIGRNISEDVKLKNYLIPRDTLVNVQIFDVHRDPNFWPQPHVYDPDRFLPERIKTRHPYSYIPFSGGPRNCIGQKFASLELKTAIAYLLYHFHLEPVNELTKVRMGTDMVLKSLNPLDVKFIAIKR